MKNKNFKFHVVITAILLSGGFTATSQTTSAYSKEIIPYVDFLKAQEMSGKDYIFHLFEKYDIVVLCEGDHREYTQYDFYYDIVTDARFAEMQGAIYTEVFSMAGTKIFERFNYSEDSAHVQQVIDSIQFGTGVFPMWTKRNIYDFLTRLYYFNRTAAPDKRIRWAGADRYINWFEIRTKEDVEQTYKPMLEGSNRDKYMAENIYRDFMQHGQKKSLVVMNYRHSFMNDSWTSANTGDGKVIGNMAAILKHRLQGRVTNVWVHSVNVSSNTFAPVLEGKLDAAFLALSNPSLGFDMQGSPLGDKFFELWTAKKHTLTFQDVFHGYVFYNPVSAQRLYDGIPEYYSIPENMDELKRRCSLTGTKMRWDNAKKMYEDKKPFPFHKQTQRKIAKWLGKF
ncbi:MAG: hypothetical protein LBL13_08820 [Bacteroidales bacterium]|jgi:hypothetical protein|nr:hypothetical protein [Bacteroidales bacterium]